MMRSRKRFISATTRWYNCGNDISPSQDGLSNRFQYTCDDGIVFFKEDLNGFVRIVKHRGFNCWFLFFWFFLLWFLLFWFLLLRSLWLLSRHFKWLSPWRELMKCMSLIHLMNIPSVYGTWYTDLPIMLTTHLEVTFWSGLVAVTAYTPLSSIENS